MPGRKYPYVIQERSRHGKLKYYVRRGKGPRIRLPDDYGSREFAEAYRAALAGDQPPPRSRPIPAINSLADMLDRYQQSHDFISLAPATRRKRAWIYRRIPKEALAAPAAAIRRANIEAGLDARAGKPGNALDYLKAMRAAFRWAVARGIVPVDPTEGARFKAPKTAGWKPWTREDIAAFMARWPLGTREYLAFCLILFTGLRRANIVTLGRQHVQGDILVVRTQKTGTPVYARITPALRDAIEAVPRDGLAFLQTKEGHAFTPSGFTNWFGEACRAAGVKGTPAHGLRKGAATIAADLGATAHELMGAFGWTDLATAAIYTREADRKRGALAAFDKVAGAFAEQPENKLPRTYAQGAGLDGNKS